MSKKVGISLKKIISSGYIGQSQVITGAKALDKIVTRTNVMVDPDIVEWSNQGELILSTGYFFENATLDEQKKIIKEMSKLGVSALGIKVNPYLEKLPDELVNLANELNFVIIDIDYNLSFTDIMIPILQDIYDEQTKIMRKVEIIHKDNMNVVLKGGGVKDILKSLSKTMRNPIYVVDHHFEEMIEQGNIKDALSHKIKEQIVQYFDGKKNNKMISKTQERSIFIEGKEIRQLLVPIMVKNNVYGHLITFGINNELTRFDILNLESSSNVIALEFLKRLSVQDVENRYKAEFFEDLISLDKKRISKAIERSSHYGFYKDANYLVIRIDLLKDSLNIEKDYLAQVINKSIYLINLICKDKKRPFLISNKGSSINILVMYNKDLKIKKKTLSLVKNIDQVLKSKISNLNSAIGIGRSYQGLDMVHKSLNDAVKAVDAYGSFTHDEIIFFEDLGIYKIFCHEELREELLGFYNENLSKLVAYDEKRDANLVNTLSMYFEQNGNLKKMSEELYTHYNTILYRMKRIQEICEIDINNRKQRYDLETALEIHRIINK